MQALLNHTSPESAYMVQDYPYGGMRCRIRFWLESDPKKGFRFCSQTEHPKRLVWNNPKKSTYSLLAGCMYLDDKGHVVWSGLSEYSSAADVAEFIEKYPGSDLSRLKAWCIQKSVFSMARAKGKARWTINGVVQEDTEEEIKRHEVESASWTECSELVR
jgi:hypothetical protein